LEDSVLSIGIQEKATLDFKRPSKKPDRASEAKASLAF
jgi:hypothetical protein